MIPFLPTARWYASRLKGISFDGLNEENKKEEIKEARMSCARALIQGNQGEIMLSVPVQGGAPKLKKSPDPSVLPLSEHGNWRHVHLGALEACYGRTPFFIHLFPALQEVYSGSADTLGMLNSTIDSIISSFLLMGKSTDECTMQPVFTVPPEGPVAERAAEVARLINPEISVIDAIMRLGPETLLGLLALNIRQ